MPYVNSQAWTKADIDTLKNMIKSGASETEVAVKLGRNVLGVRVKAKRLDLKFKPPTLRVIKATTPRREVSNR